MLGVLWVILNPLLMTLVMAAVFSYLFSFRFSLKSYFIYLICGLIAWNFFQQSISSSMQSMAHGSSLLKRINIPKTVFVISNIGVELVELFLTLIPLFFVAVLLAHPIKTTILFLPLSILLLTMFTLGLALHLSMLAVHFTDIINIFQVLVRIWFFLTPVFYPVDILPMPYREYIYLNPMYNFIELFRGPVYYGLIPSVQTIFTAACWAVLSLGTGWWCFTKRSDQIPYRI